LGGLLLTVSRSSPVRQDWRRSRDGHAGRLPMGGRAAAPARRATGTPRQDAASPQPAHRRGRFRTAL